MRQGSALQALHRYQEAIVAYQKGLEYDKHNNDLKTALDHVKARQRKEEKQKKKIKPNKFIPEPTHFLKASDFSDPKKVALIVEQIGTHGTDLKVSFPHELGQYYTALLRPNTHAHTRTPHFLPCTNSQKQLTPLCFC